MKTADEIPRRLAEHLEDWLGAWPPVADRLTVVSSPRRSTPGWDHRMHPYIGVATATSGVFSVPESDRQAVEDVVAGKSLNEALRALRDHMSSAIDRAGSFSQGLFRWSDRPADTPDTGEWVPTNDARVPDWLKPFNGDVLIAWADDASYGAGVGRKQHDRFGHEIAVGTEESLRGRGIARKLVATAARRILDDGAVATYLHAMSNHASAKVAEASGFPDRGWTVLDFYPTDPFSIAPQ